MNAAPYCCFFYFIYRYSCFIIIYIHDYNPSSSFLSRTSCLCQRWLSRFLPTDSRSAMTPPARPLLLLLMVMMTSLPASAVEPETCFSRQHHSAIVNVRQARPSSAMSARKLQSERDCVLACCSEDVKPGESHSPAPLPLTHTPVCTHE